MSFSAAKTPGHSLWKISSDPVELQLGQLQTHQGQTQMWETKASRRSPKDLLSWKSWMQGEACAVLRSLCAMIFDTSMLSCSKHNHCVLIWFLFATGCDNAILCQVGHETYRCWNSRRSQPLLQIAIPLRC